MDSNHYSYVQSYPIFPLMNKKHKCFHKRPLLFPVTLRLTSCLRMGIALRSLIQNRCPCRSFPAVISRPHARISAVCVPVFPGCHRGRTYLDWLMLFFGNFWSDATFFIFFQKPQQAVAEHSRVRLIPTEQTLAVSVFHTKPIREEWLMPHHVKVVLLQQLFYPSNLPLIFCLAFTHPLSIPCLILRYMYLISYRNPASSVPCAAGIPAAPVPPTAPSP